MGKLTVFHKEEHAEESGVTLRMFIVKGQDDVSTRFYASITYILVFDSLYFNAHN